MTVAALPSKIKSLPLLEQMTIARAEVNAIDHNQYVGLNQIVVGKFKQQFGNCIFWYSQWDKNRDYSSVINTSMALGKLSMMFDTFCYTVENTAEMTELSATINHIFTQCWNNIQEATGRIVPFQE